MFYKTFYFDLLCCLPPGTCTVIVEVRDVNDVPPRWAYPEWALQVPEGQPLETVLATLPVTDPDRANKLAYRVSYDVHCKS